MTYEPFDVIAWNLKAFDCNTDSHEFGEFQSIVELWNSKREHNRLPAWQDFKFNEFADWYGWMSVCDISYDPVFDIHFRLWGTNVVNFMGYELTGKSPRINTEPPFEYTGGYAQDDFDFFEQLIKKSAIGTEFASLTSQNRSYKKYNEIILPLADNGQTIDKFLFILNPIK